MITHEENTQPGRTCCKAMRPFRTCHAGGCVRACLNELWKQAHPHNSSCCHCNPPVAPGWASSAGRGASAGQCWYQGKRKAAHTCCGSLTGKAQRAELKGTMASTDPPAWQVWRRPLVPFPLAFLLRRPEAHCQTTGTWHGVREHLSTAAASKQTRPPHHSCSNTPF
jgi:hypothetical protein